jgi:peroxiredoxin
MKMGFRSHIDVESVLFFLEIITVSRRVGFELNHFCKEMQESTFIILSTKYLEKVGALLKHGTLLVI